MTPIRFALLFLPAAAWGVIAALWTPRGPLTGAEALWSIVISAGVGVLAGRAARSRWAILLAPSAYVAALELTRWSVSGPSVDLPHATPIGILVLVTGRGVHGLFALLPMAAGAAFGHRRPARARWRRVTGRVGAGLTAVLTVGLGVAVAVPARTASISGGVAELSRTGDLALMIRGRSAALPVLLYVPGPPGGSDTGLMRTRLAGLEDHFVVATLDRRGGGASAGALGRAATLSLDSEVADILAVTDHLRQRFGRDRIVLLGHSGGSIPAVVAARRHPEKYRAYVGTGQAVDLRESDRMFYTDVLAWARAGGRTDVVEQLERQGPPPWADVYDYEPFLLYATQAYGLPDPPIDLNVPEYTLLQKAHYMTTMLDTWDALYPRLQGVDLHREVPSLPIPAYFVQGGREMRGLAVPFASWYTALQSPDKRLITFPETGHRPMAEQPQRFITTLADLIPA
ncbi:alpha/beta fold hydrolase [Actinoplanes sichuanensis]|uniref:Alpha/beta fold hydrolase n=1 Tax=Actinoplanes sichuanensis TaxID=512349 RepID=A0ABW4AH67_9ACTN|nr:alpha/beta hydrolase [Actinoplanes sichuanensis]